MGYKEEYEEELRDVAREAGYDLSDPSTSAQFFDDLPGSTKTERRPGNSVDDTLAKLRPLPRFLDAEAIAEIDAADKSAIKEYTQRAASFFASNTAGFALDPPEILKSSTRIAEFLRMLAETMWRARLMACTLSCPQALLEGKDLARELGTEVLTAAEERWEDYNADLCGELLRLPRRRNQDPDDLADTLPGGRHPSVEACSDLVLDIKVRPKSPFFQLSVRFRLTLLALLKDELAGYREIARMRVADQESRSASAAGQASTRRGETLDSVAAAAATLPTTAVCGSISTEILPGDRDRPHAAATGSAKPVETGAVATATTNNFSDDASEAWRCKGYRAEVSSWMKKNKIPNATEAAKELGIGRDVLKSIISSITKTRCSRDTLSRVLAKIVNAHVKA